ncbi:unnamed protein product [Urochloa humidicola]
MLSPAVPSTCGCQHQLLPQRAYNPWQAASGAAKLCFSPAMLQGSISGNCALASSNAPRSHLSNLVRINKL